MIKKIAFAAVGIALLASPLVVSAQTTSSNASLIAQLTALVQILTQELQQLLAARSSVPASQPQAQGMTTPIALACNNAEVNNLKRGDTDATTGGKVSQLQTALGVSPASGYYGSLTSIAYTNFCIGGNYPPQSVTGMSKYTDSNFGFSFWYPSGWTVNKTLSGSGSFSSWEIMITNPSNNAQSLAILELTNDSATDTFGSYYFDAQSSTWMHRVGNNLPQTADISNNTMGGLHIFSGDNESFIPLSANKFLQVSPWSTDSSINADYLTNTILATDQSVAIPVSTAQQTATIEAELNAFITASGVSSSGIIPSSQEQMASFLANQDTFQTYTNAQYGFSVQYDPSSFTRSTPSAMPFMGWPTASNTLLTLYYTGGKNIAGFDSAAIVFGASGAVTYEDCTRILSSSDVVQGATKEVTINGRTFYQDSSGGAATGHYSNTQSYRTYYNGACYEISFQIDTSRTDDGSAGDVTPVSNALQAVLNSLTFTSPDTAPVIHATATPQWSTFVGQSTPTSFTYPGSFLVYESEDESDVAPGQKAGLQSFQSSQSPGAIAVQMTPSKYFPAGDSATQAMQANMKTEPIGYQQSGYQTISLGGEVAYTRSDTVATGFSVIYVAHENAYYRILLMNPLLPNEYQTFLSSFKFTN